MNVTIPPSGEDAPSTTCSEGTPSSPYSLVLGRRLLLLLAFLAFEWLPISALVSTGRGGQSIARGLVVMASLFLGFGYLKSKRMIQRISQKAAVLQTNWRFLAAHIAAMLVFLALCSPAIAGRTTGLASSILTASWFVAGLLAIITAGCTFVPLPIWSEFLRSTGNLWLYTTVAGVAAWNLVPVLWSAWNSTLWKPVTDLTFELVKILLSPFLRELLADRTTLTIGTGRFTVMIGGACSGLEGAGLMLVFSLVWLWLFRRECRFPHAFLLIPAGMVIMFFLNAVRIAALILIGNAGARGIAMGGFHSQAGWIAFNLVALSFSLAAPRVSWLMLRDPSQSPHTGSATSPTVAYLLPFAAILAAAMITRAVSAGFEWFYPLRFFAAAAALWFCRQQYKKLDWKPGWVSILAGSVVFLMWLALARGTQANNGIAAGLASLSPPARIAWLVCRILAAVVTVPLAEELAFRGFLLRRLISSDFEAVSFRRFTYFAVIASSILFGLMHGDRWIAGSVAGAIYAIVMLRRGRIGDAVLAHATTNALLAAWVVCGAQWQFW